MITWLGLAIPLVMLPGFVLMTRRGKHGPPMTPVRRQVAKAAGLLVFAVMAGVAVLGVVRASGVPGPDGPVVRVALDATPPDPDPPAGARVVLRGTPRPDLSVDYDEVIQSKHGADIRHSHTIVPMTAAGWTSDQPVHFLTDLRGAADLPGLPRLPWTKYRDTAPGVLVAGSVPGYLVRAFADRGIAPAADARMHTTSMRSAREPWIGIAIGAGVIAGISLVGALLVR